MSGSPQVTTLGEALIVMAPLSRGPLRHVGAFEKRVGGAELNVAVCLSRLGHRAGWAGRLGADEFGEEVVAFLRGEGVDSSRAVLDPEVPTGVYFKERRALNKLRVHYYRAGSAASRLRFDQLDLDYLLSGKILHLSGITPALSESCREATQRLILAARQRGVTVSFDANVRLRLFEERDPRTILMPLIEEADLLFVSDEEAELLLGGSDAEALRRALEETKARTIVAHGAGGALTMDESGPTEGKSYPVEEVDTVGAGDAFVAGFLSGRLRGWEAEGCLALANACGACAVTVPGDAESMPFEEEALSLVRCSSGIER